MRHAREIIRLKFSCVSTHEIARRLGMACSTVRETLKRTETAGLSWPLPEDMSEGAREAALYASRRSKRADRLRHVDCVEQRARFGRIEYGRLAALHAMRWPAHR